MGFPVGPPQVRHRRRESPPAYNNYKYFKPVVRREFAGKCVYCHMPDGPKDPALFAVEHYLPKRPFQHLECTYSNLFYACLNCNSRKGNYYPKTAEEKASRFIANPCDHVMTEHVKFDRERVVAKSKVGQFMVERLDLNLDEIVDYRGFILSSIRDNVRRRRRAFSALRALENLVASNPALAGEPGFNADMAKTREAFTRAEANLRRLLSTDDLPQVAA